MFHNRYIIRQERGIVPLLFLCFQKSNVFVGCRSADVAHSRQFADVELPVFVGGIVPQKYGGDVLFAEQDVLPCFILLRWDGYQLPAG